MHSRQSSGFSTIVCLWLLLVVFNAVGGIMSEAAIVAFVLGIAIAENANILSFESVCEKFREGRPMHETLPAGESSAPHTFLDASAPAVIVGAVRA
jgi:SecD/SecF fusion protein